MPAWLVGELFYPYTGDIDGTYTGYRGQGTGASGENRQKMAAPSSATSATQTGTS